MSFFDEIFKSFNIKSIDEVCVSMVLGYGVFISGNVRVIDVSEDAIILKCKAKFYNVVGSDLIIKSLAKGEIFVEGNVHGFVRCDYEKWS